jgi:hypothetical protein
MNASIDPTKIVKSKLFVTAVLEQLNRKRLERFSGISRSLVEPSPSRAAGDALRRHGVMVFLRAALILLPGLVGFAESVIAGEPLSTWHTRVSPYGTTNNWKAITFGNGRFVAMNGAGGRVMTSVNGTDWTAQSANTNKAFSGIAFGGGKFVGVGSSGLVMTSADGASWQPQNSGTSAHLYDVGYNGEQFVAVGGGTIISSPTGTMWTSHDTGSTNQWRASAFGNGTNVVVGYRTLSPDRYTRSAASPTLSNWELRDTGASMYLSGVTFGAGKFVACGYGGIIQTSVDGVNWTDPIQPGSAWLYSTTFDNNTFMAVGEMGVITSSTNGTSWSTLRAGSGQVLNGIAFGNGTWVAVGNNGLILQSDPISATAEPAVVLTDASYADGEFSFRFNGVPGQTYQVEASTNMTHWTTLTSILCTNSPMSCTLTGQNLPKRFYRIVKP